MATGPGLDQGKGTFLREFLAANNDANEESVNEAWTEEGREGTISVSLISKIKAELGLTNRKKSASKSQGAAKSPRKGKKPTSSSAQSPRPLNGEQTSTRVASKTRHGDDGDVLDELEEDLDELIQKIRDVGDRPDVVKALRRARRILVRSHEG